MPGGVEPIADDELIYRRVSATANPVRFDVATRTLSDQAFAPSKYDDTGISVWRAKFKTEVDAALGQPGKSYYVAILRVRDLLDAGIRIEPRPDTPAGFEPGHAELPDLRYDNRKDSRTLSLQRTLAKLSEVVGPFATPPAQS